MLVASIPQVYVALPSGKQESFSIAESSKVGDLKRLVQKSFQQGFLRLVTAEGHVLADLDQSLQAAGLQEGEHLTATAQQAKMAATPGAFAMWCCGCDRIVTWGDPHAGGDSSAVQDQLRSVQQVQATHSAFAAILADGYVVTWGHPDYGGDSSAVKDQLRNVQQVQATRCAFAAVLADGSVVTWGSSFSGGDSSAVQDQLKNVQQAQSTNHAFASILADGSVIAWGDPNDGGDSSAVQDQLKNAKQVQATDRAFAAILADGSIVTWGYTGAGGDSSAVQDRLRNVQQVQATRSAFAAILADGSVVTWGNPDAGGDSSAVQDQLKNVQQAQSTNHAFAAILADGSLRTCGCKDAGGDSFAVQDQLRNVQQVQATDRAFAAILADGSVVTWGDPRDGGDSSAVQDRLRNVRQVQATRSAFAAILADGSVVAWGRPHRGGDSSVVQDRLWNVQQVQATDHAFAAILADGSVVTNQEVLNRLKALREEKGWKIGLSLSGVGQSKTLAKALQTGVFDSVQATWNLMEQSCGATLKEAHDAGLEIIIKEGMANGRILQRPELLEVSEKMKVAPDALALAAIMAQPFEPMVLSGAVTAQQLRSNLEALELCDRLKKDGDALRSLMTQLQTDPDAYWKERSGRFGRPAHPACEVPASLWLCATRAIFLCVLGCSPIQWTQAIDQWLIAFDQLLQRQTGKIPQGNG
eukprot:s149_g12.t1